MKEEEEKEEEPGRYVTPRRPTHPTFTFSMGACVCVSERECVCVCAEHFTRAARRTHLKPREVIRRAALTFSPLFFLLNIEQVQLEKSRRARL